ncbi:MAG TPA: hypothetical protein VMB52_01710 [Verrucomicrobiae bacterium]|nr:hypothetical protein [Verrucomicrobiae bacterium]
MPEKKKRAPRSQKAKTDDLQPDSSRKDGVKESESPKTVVDNKTSKIASAARRVSSKKKNLTKAEPVTVVRAESGKRLLQTPKRIWYKPFTWRYRSPKPTYKPLPKARILLLRVWKQLWANWQLFGGIALVYGLLNLLLVHGLSGGSNLENFKSGLTGLLLGSSGKLASSLLTFGYLLSSSGSSNAPQGGTYQSILFVACSLAYIWALRQVLAEHKVWRIRDSFYKGMYPLVPFLLLFLLVGLQLIPLAVGGGLYGTVMANGIAVHWWEKGLWLLLLIAMALWSLRMITASIFALYIVTLPDMTPLRAYRSARKLVYRRRLLIWRKLIFLPIALLLLAAAIEIPLILFITPLATWTFFVLAMIALPLVHGYLYNLYREML